MRIKWFDTDKVTKDKKRRYYLPVKRILWTCENSGSIDNFNAILKDDHKFCILKNKTSAGPSILLDFGQEINGGISIHFGPPIEDCWKFKIRIRFGESVSEAMNNPDTEHALHDLTLEMSAFGKQEIGNTGFRFVRIDFLEKNCKINLQHIKAVALELPLEYKGSFECSDKLLNDIWKISARTVHLCCQDYILDGIKRDRMLWVGDLHAQIKTVMAAFGDIDIVEKSLDRIARDTEDGKWMNDISSYSIWYIISLWDWYFYTGNIELLKRHHKKIKSVTGQLINCITPEGGEDMPDWRFIDWPTADNKKAISQGLQAMMIWGLKSAEKILEKLGDSEKKKCTEAVKKLKYNPEKPSDNQQVNALEVLTGAIDPEKAEKNCFSKDPFKGIGTWFAYYILQARAMSGSIVACLDFIKKYWGGMLELGATSFWEHFKINWLENAASIDQVPDPGKVDVHKDRGAYCFEGLRHSLCHGWASGPCPWLSGNILGIIPAQIGCKKVKIKPYTGGLKWAKGTFPIPSGNIKIFWENNDNCFNFELNLPDQVTAEITLPEKGDIEIIEGKAEIKDKKLMKLNAESKSLSLKVIKK